MNTSRFFRDDRARIPFSVLGIFLLVGSGIATVFLSQIEYKKSMEISRSLEYDDIDFLLSSFESNIADALNSAGMKALSEIGKKPVVTSSFGPGDEINHYRIKGIIRNELIIYLTNNYVDNVFSDGRYAINIILENKALNLSLEAINIKELPMELKRVSLPLFGPRETQNMSTYMVVSVCLPIEIRMMQGSSWELLTKQDVSISSLLTSRFPLLESLMQDFHQMLNGTFSSLWGFTTAFSNLYSFVRGFKHYRCGEPLNIMDNHHLSLIVNSGILLSEACVFGSVDPLALIDLAKQTRSALKQSPVDRLLIFTTEMQGDGYVVSTDNLTKGTANIDAQDPINESIDELMCINLSDIAERVLYNLTSVTLHFENDLGVTHDEFLTVEEGFYTNMTKIICYWANQSYVLRHVTKQVTMNMTSYHHVMTLCTEIYHALYCSMVVERLVKNETVSNPGPGWNDGGVTEWTSSSFLCLSKNLIKPPKGQISPGSPVYEERYNVTYERVHCWWQQVNQTVNGTIIPVKLWQNTTDFLVEQVTINSYLQHSVSYQDSQDDVYDILYFNETVDDVNLEDTVASYLLMWNDSSTEKQQAITTRNNEGLYYHNTSVQGMIPHWVVEEIWFALEEIVEKIQQISPSAGINQTSYPDPFVLLEMMQNDLLNQYQAHTEEYLCYAYYHPHSLFCSVGKKVIYSSRAWFVDVVWNQTQDVFSRMQTQLTGTLSAVLSTYTEFSPQNLTETLTDVSDAIRNQFTIPFGYDMNLTRYTSEGERLWNETIRLAIDHTPDYLDPFEKTGDANEELWPLKIRNRCIFGPTGLPILPPSPVTPWLLTMNLWVIDVEGEFTRIKLIDTSDETIWNPLLGHEPQLYIRELHIISNSNITLGENTRLSFGFTTVALSFVPPWGMMVGDIQENWFDDHTPGFDIG
jgi:hypothetical protein